MGLTKKIMVKDAWVNSWSQWISHGSFILCESHWDPCHTFLPLNILSIGTLWVLNFLNMLNNLHVKSFECKKFLYKQLHHCFDILFSYRTVQMKIHSGVPALSWNFIEVNCHKICVVGRLPRCWPNRLWLLFSWLIPTVLWSVVHLKEPSQITFVFFGIWQSTLLQVIWSILLLDTLYHIDAARTVRHTIETG